VVLATVTRVVEEAGVPMRMSAVHAAVEQLLGAPVPRSTVNEALSTQSRGGDARFRRVRRGVYALAP
jgi:Arc/MetJ family transcription regulator